MPAAAKKEKPPPQLLPWQLPVERIPADAIVAIRAIADGTANEHQQRRAFEFIREDMCGVDRMTYWPGGEDGRRASDFAEGKRWVGTMLRRITRLKPERVDPRGAPPAMPGQTQE